MCPEVGADTVQAEVVTVCLWVAADTGQLSVWILQAAGTVGVAVGTLGTAGNIVDIVGRGCTGVGRHH